MGSRFLRGSGGRFAVEEFDDIGFHFGRLGLALKAFDDVAVAIQKELREIPAQILVELTVAEILDVLVEGMRMGPVHLNLGEHRERHAVVAPDEVLDLCFIPGILAAKLVAGEAQDDQAAVFVVIPESLQSAELGGKPSKTGGVDDQDYFAFVFAQGGLGSVDFS